GSNHLSVSREPAQGPPTINEALFVTGNPDGNVAVRVNPVPAFAEHVPLLTTLKIVTSLTNDPPREMWVDINGDSIIDTVAPFSATFTATYTSFGRYLPAVTIKTASGRLYTSLPGLTSPVTLLEPSHFLPAAPELPAGVVDAQLDSRRLLYV